MSAEMFWLLLTAVCVLWYSTVTIYVAIRGAFDIKSMLSRLSRSQEEPAPDRIRRDG